MNCKRVSTLVGIVALQALCVGSSAGQGPMSMPGPVTVAGPEVFEAVSQFYTYDREVPLNAEVAVRQEFPTFIREKVVFTGIRPVRVPAYLALPRAGAGPFPVVVLIDGVTGSKERWFETDSWPRGTLVSHALLEAGIAVLSLDARHHGERIWENDFRAPQAASGPVGRDMIVPSIIEHRRAMDYLATRPEIDAGRIGVLGLSMGGMMTFALTSLDPRVRVAVAGVTPVGVMKGRESIPVAPQTFAGQIRDTPILLQMGRTDPFYTVEDARQLYSAIPSARKELVLYDAGHQLPPEYAPKAVEWLRDHLGVR
jgi:dienelactone hydrolase